MKITHVRRYACIFCRQKQHAQINIMYDVDQFPLKNIG
jgi:hypothetical protein